jgi:hypothetical protein
MRKQDSTGEKQRTGDNAQSGWPRHRIDSNFTLEGIWSVRYARPAKERM